VDQNKREFWSVLLTKYESSNQTVTSFCEEHDIAVWNFYYWKKRLKQASIAFEEVSIAEEATSTGIHLSIGLLDIHLQSDFDDVTLRRVLSVLSC